MYKIQANKSGTRSISVSDENLQTIKQYNLLQWLIDSNGIVTEAVLDKLRLNVRSMLSAGQTSKQFIDLCIDVIFHKDMKALGLENLTRLFEEWNTANSAQD